MGKQRAKGAAQGSAQPQSVSWPALHPPQRPLQLVEPSPGIILVEDFFPPAIRKAFLSFLTAPNSPLRLNPPTAPKRGEAERTNARTSVQDPEFAKRLWEDTGLREACRALEGRNGRKAAGLNPNIRVYRYGEGDFFGPHYDDDIRDPATGWTSEWTLLIYLTGREDGVVGGETAFYPSPTRKDNGPAVVPELRAGRALLHRHGQLCSLHEGRLVEKGTKWVLRSDVLFA
ncbi:hypothetical protein NBRC10512_004189 [Rhodotorula toruloides]|uniref:RHTO0S25e01970g1_1 n=2 Tax=Rhodotorula toruloides TaxID=5286 RepID=A0A061BMY4_RHOTO|nr:oxoglutarate/iron-dependent oxygenase [Rhodotorula toruloides NP11]EMS18789.1 oxoglutarate/iron-dependent oxygenase [Rhodotorula toruloides NP11]KAJ8296847.1 hypothetical protein OF846_000124 [Rhodotorula toruloides]CDR49354.1 RHTO0S25e01970g1_1 [Rhodotorula toruloides]